MFPPCSQPPHDSQFYNIQRKVDRDISDLKLCNNLSIFKEDFN